MGLLAKIKSKLQHYFMEEDWNIGLIDKPIKQLFSDPTFFDVIQWVEKGKDYFLADPFPIPNSSMVLCEYYSFSERIGKIVQFDAAKTPVELSSIGIESETHLSYPFTFQEGEKLFCIPESSAREDLRLYAFSEGRFVEEKLLMKGEDILGGTIIHHDDLYYLFCTKARESYGNQDLHIYFSSKLGSEWKAHSQNPHKSNPRGSRSAGAIFEVEGELYRPAQNCSDSYGKSIVLYKIMELNEKSFKEEEFMELKADTFGRYKNGIHTINAFGDKTLIDGKRSYFSFLKAIRLLSAKMKSKV